MQPDAFRLVYWKGRTTVITKEERVKYFEKEAEKKKTKKNILKILSAAGVRIVG